MKTAKTIIIRFLRPHTLLHLSGMGKARTDAKKVAKEVEATMKDTGENRKHKISVEFVFAPERTDEFLIRLIISNRPALWVVDLALAYFEDAMIENGYSVVCK